MEPEEEEVDVWMKTMEKLERFIEGDDEGTTFHEELKKEGWTAPQPEGLSDEELTRALTDLIWYLYDYGVVVDDADHLSDRELYLELLDYCEERSVFFPEDPDMWCHWSPIGGCSEEDNLANLRYYADDDERADWAEQFPEDYMPPSELPPYFRSWLPQRSDVRNP